MEIPSVPSPELEMSRQDYLKAVFDNVAMITQYHGDPLYDETQDVDDTSGTFINGDAAELGRVAYIQDAEKAILKDEIIVASYTNDTLALKHSGFVGEEIGMQVDLVGHIEFRRSFGPITHPSASVEGVFYLQRDGDILLKLTSELDQEELLSEESKLCFNLAQELGMGVRFTEALYKHAEDSGRVISQGQIGLIEAISLGKFLGRYISEQPTG